MEREQPGNSLWTMLGHLFIISTPKRLGGGVMPTCPFFDHSSNLIEETHGVLKHDITTIFTHSHCERVSECLVNYCMVKAVIRSCSTPSPCTEQKRHMSEQCIHHRLPALLCLQVALVDFPLRLILSSCGGWRLLATFFRSVVSSWFCISESIS